MQVLIDKGTRAIVGYGEFPTPPTDDAILCLTVSDTEAEKLTRAGTKSLDADGRIIVTPPDPKMLAGLPGMQ
jgi:hypothetical protein